MISDWQSSIARADMADWVTVAVYLLAALLSAWAARHARLTREARENMFWRFIAVLLVLLGVNELLDLQMLLTSVGRAHAQANGWYGERRTVQYVFVIVLGVAAMIAWIVMLWLARRMHAAVWLALAGLAFVGMFALLRAASFHHLDEILGVGRAAFNLGSLQEMAGAMIVAAAAALYVRKPRRKR